jgi:hypothetical protein
LACGECVGAAVGLAVGRDVAVAVGRTVVRGRAAPETEGLTVDRLTATGVGDGETSAPGLAPLVEALAIGAAAGPGRIRPSAGRESGTMPGEPTRLIPRSAR